MESESEYLRRRAEQEQEAAERAEDPKARELHNELAARYRDAANGKRMPADESTARTSLPDDFRILE